jgi:hypothetical protein
LRLEVLENRLVLSPAAVFSNTGPVNEGSLVRVAFSNATDTSSAAAAGGYHYSYALSAGALAGSYASAGTSALQTFTFTDVGTYTVFGRIFDNTDAFTDYSTQIGVNDVAPTATFSNNGPINVGGSVTASFSNASVPSHADTQAGFHYSFALRITALPTTYAAAGTASSVTFTSATFGSPGTYAVYGRIFGQDDGFRTYLTKVTIKDAPSATLSNNGPINEGGAVTVSFSNVVDPSAVETAAGFHYSLALSQSALAATYAAAGTSSSANFTFDDNGTYTVYGRVFDKDNGYTDYATQVTVNNVPPTATLSNNGPIN